MKIYENWNPYNQWRLDEKAKDEVIIMLVSTCSSEQTGTLIINLNNYLAFIDNFNFNMLKYWFVFFKDYACLDFDIIFPYMSEKLSFFYHSLHNNVVLKVCSIFWTVNQKLFISLLFTWEHLRVFMITKHTITEWAQM